MTITAKSAEKWYFIKNSPQKGAVFVRKLII